MVSVTCVFCEKPSFGWNVAVSPETVQLPSMFGESAGSAVGAASASLKVTLIGAAPLASWEPLDGVTERVCNGAIGLAGAAGFAGCVSTPWRVATPEHTPGCPALCEY